MGEVIEFPGRRSCFTCEHFSTVLSRCFLFDEPVDSEVYAARDCNGYEVANG